MALALADIDEASAAETQRLCEARNPRVTARAYKLDVGDHTAVNACAAQVEADFGQGVTMLVNNAGIVHVAEFAEQTKEEFDRVMKVYVLLRFN